MSSEEVLVQIAEEFQPVEMLEENYTLLPYIKVDDEGLMVLNEEIYEEQASDEQVLCVPITETLFDCNIESDIIEEQVESGDFLSEHNYHTISDGENPYDMYLEDMISKDNLVSSSKLQCPLCMKVLKATDAFYRHLRIHSGEKPYQCELCDKKFSQQSNLWKHILIHTGERRFECPQCGKKFSQRANMQKHMMVHTGEKPFECYICSRLFTQRANLNKHIRIHTGEKPYTCKYCSRQFAQQSNMQKHELLHEGLKPFSCGICSAAFAQQSNLKKHVVTHFNKERTHKSVAARTCDMSKSYSVVCENPYTKTDLYYGQVKDCIVEPGTFLDTLMDGRNQVYFDSSSNVKIEIELEQNRSF